MQFLERHTKAAMGVAIVVIALSILSVFRSKQPPSVVTAGVNTFFDELSWQVLSVTDHLPSGSKLMILTLSGEVESSGAKNYQAIYKALEKKGFTVSHVEGFDWDSGRGWMPSVSLPYGEFIQAAEAHPEVDAVVSLCGPPIFQARSNWPAASTLPPLLVTRVLPQDGSLPGLIKQGRVQAAAVPKGPPAAGEVRGDDPGSKFEILRSGN